jgi:hypothetical protein
MRVYLILIAIIGFGLDLGRSQAEPSATTAPASKTGADLLARVHFIGGAQLLADPNSARFREIASLPVTGELREQTLQKLATAPFRYLQGKVADKTKDNAALIRPLWEDLLRAEWYLEMCGPANQVPETLLAVRLDKARAELWNKNLSTVMTSWTALPVKEITANGFKGWEVKKHKDPDTIRFIRAGDWVLFGWGQNDLLLQPSMLDRIKSQGRPVPEAGNYWLDAWLDLAGLTRQHPLPVSFSLPKTHVTIAGAKDFVRTKMTMEFPQPLNFKLDPWQIPTNLIHDPLISFSATRGINPWLEQFKTYQELNVDRMPRQFYVWALAGAPFETSFAAPVQNGRKFMEQFGPRCMSLINSNIQGRNTGEMRWMTNHDGIVWGGLIPVVSPFLRTVAGTNGGCDFIAGGLFAGAGHRKTPPPTELLNQLLGRKDTVYYGWEITEERLNQWNSISSVYWVMHGDMLGGLNLAGQKWLQAVKTNLSNCGTTITLSGPNELTLVRNSSIGFNGLELTLLRRWFDAANFPLDARYERPRRPPGLAKPPPAK